MIVCKAFVGVALCLLLMGCTSSEKTHNSSLLNINEFEEDIQAAVDLLKEQVGLIDTIAGFEIFKYEILSIVLPEVIRWNAFQDWIETKADETLCDYELDFSIGIFQMKPSFIRQLEKYVDENLITSCQFIRIPLTDSPKKAKLRIERMQTVYWQLRYAYAFWIVAEHRFRCLQFKNTEERIGFYAAAYNYGFMKPVEEILQWQNKKLFPYGSKYTEKQESYADFAVAFYKTLKSNQLNAL